jgi:SAM-dependent methyltransferase
MYAQTFSTAKRLARTVLPTAITSRWSRWRISAMVRRSEDENRRRSASDVFDDIYKENKWGGDFGKPFSGSGSVGASATDYITLVNGFISAKSINSVLDIGCGDFRVGKELSCKKYTGIDVAPSVIKRNNEVYGSPTRDFMCLDAAGIEPLPQAELCLIRQVFQHLSNAQISAILTKLEVFPYIIVTEHQPSDGDFVSANADKVHGAFTRLFSGSGVYLDKPPFNLSVQLLLETTSANGYGDAHSRGKIRTFLIRKSSTISEMMSSSKE